MLLGRTVNERGSVAFRIVFKDELGQGYIPIEDTVFYSLYAQLKGDKSWAIVNKRKKVPLRATSIIDLVLQGPDLALRGDCTTKRQALIEWQYLKDNEPVLGRDIVEFEVTALPGGA